MKPISTLLTISVITNLASKLKLIIATVIMTICLMPSTYAINFYWVGGSGNWSAYASHWATTSGGSTFQTQVPSSNDNVFFDANSFTGAGQTVTIDQTIVYTQNLDWSGAAFNPTFAGPGSNSVRIFGSLRLISTMNITFSGAWSFRSNALGNTITMGNQLLPSGSTIYFEGAGGEWIQQDSLKLFCTGANPTGYIYHNNGIWRTNNQYVKCGSLNPWTSPTATRELHLGSSTFVVYAPFDGKWNINATGMTFTAGTSTIIIDGTQGAYYAAFTGGGFPYNNVTFQANNSQITTNTTFNGTLKVAPGKTLDISNTTQTIGAAGTLDINGNCSQGSVDIRGGTFSKASGIVTADFVVLTKNTAAGGATFNATNATNGGGNAGWGFTLKASQNFFWVGGTGNWNDGANHWSFSSGGPPSGCVPSPADNVFFDANSFTAAGQIVTMNVANAFCKNMNWTGALFNPSFKSGSTYEGTAPNLRIYGSLTFIPAMITTTLNFTLLKFDATTLGNTVTMAGCILQGNAFFEGVGGEWILQDSFRVMTNVCKIYHYGGTLRTNNQFVEAYLMFSTGLGRVGLFLSNSTIHLTSASGQGWWMVSPGGLTTFDAGTSTIIIDAGSGMSAANFQGGSALTYYNVTFKAPICQSYDNNTFNGVYKVLPGVVLKLSAGITQTISATGSVDANGSCAQIIIIQSATAGTQATFSKAAGAVTISYTMLLDIRGLGGATFTANNAINGGNVTGWTINPSVPKNFYWIANTGNWGDTLHWSFTSGGPVCGCIPGPSDDVFFDVNSFSSVGRTVTINVPNAFCRNMDWTGSLFSPTFTGSTTNNLRIYGSLKFISAMTVNMQPAVYFKATTLGNTITMAGQKFAFLVYFEGVGGEWILQDPFEQTQNNGPWLWLELGTLRTNNQPMKLRAFIAGGVGTCLLDLSGSTITIDAPPPLGAGSDAQWQMRTPAWGQPAGLTLNAGTSTIIMDVTSVNPGLASYFHGGGLTYNNVTFKAGTNTVYENNTFNGTFKILPGKTMLLTSGTTQTFAGSGTIDATGTAAFPIEIKSTIGGSIATFSKATGIVCLNYVRFSDNTAIGGAQFYAGANSTNVTNNAGWIFTDCPIPLPVELLSFTGEAIDAINVLNWTIANKQLLQSNTDIFDIERSQYGIDFSNIGQVKGMVNSASPQSYNFKDEQPFSGLSYYRLKITDLNANATYTKTIAILNGKPTLTLKPNPTNGILEINCYSEQSEETTLSILDITGKQVYTNKIPLQQGANQHSINLTHLQNGTYFILIQSDKNIFYGELVKVE